MWMGGQQGSGNEAPQQFAVKGPEILAGHLFTLVAPGQYRGEFHLHTAELAGDFPTITS